MPIAGIRELSRRLSDFVEKVEKTGRPLVITRHGQPVAAMVRVRPDDLEAFILAHAAEFVESADEAEFALARGDTRSLEQVLTEIAADEPSQPKDDPKTRS